MFARLARIRAVPAWTLKSSASGALRIKALPAVFACANDNSAGSRVALTRDRRARPVLSCRWVRDAVSGRLECRWVEEKSRQTGAEDPYSWRYSWRMMSRVYAQVATASRSAAAMSPAGLHFDRLGPRAATLQLGRAHRVWSATFASLPSSASAGGQDRKAFGQCRMDSRVLPGGTAERALRRRVVVLSALTRPPSRVNFIGIRSQARVPASG
jgi:hypothetical protein